MSRMKSNGGLAFRILHDLNMALLGKGWRFITHPSSLTSHLFKARYFSDSSFLSARIRGNTSYIWRSIMEAQVLLKRGAVGRGGT